MRDVDLSAFVNRPHAAYFGHVSASPTGDAVGLVVVHVENGRYPCLGLDSIPDDGYAGDVCRDHNGLALAGVPVQYFQMQCADNQNSGAHAGRKAPRRKLIAETTTDDNGRHALWLEPGTYQYQFIGPTGLASELQTVQVLAGRLVSWETVDQNGQSAAFSREIGQVYEDLVCDWNERDNGEMFEWNDVEQTITDVSRLASFRYITFDKAFCKPDMISALSRRGVHAFSGDLAEGQVSAAYRNLRALGDAGCLSLSKHPAANAQLRLGAQWANDKRVQAPEGVARYLADARACAIYFAAQTASMEQPQSLDGFSPISHLGATEFLSGAAATDLIMDRMLPKRPCGAVPDIRYVPLGTAKKEPHHGW